MRVSILLLTATACFRLPEPTGDETILAIGDSYMAWNQETGESIPDAIGTLRGEQVLNRSVGGTMLTGGEWSIPEQLVDGPFDWLVLTGGGNDVAECGCDCDEVVDAILSEDATSGVLVDIAREFVEAGGRVALLGYPELPEGAEGFEGCEDELVTFRTRGTLLAELQPGVVFADGASRVSRDDRDLFDPDLVHPSPQGARVLAQLVVERMADAE